MNLVVYWVIVLFSVGKLVYLNLISVRARIE